MEENKINEIYKNCLNFVLASRGLASENVINNSLIETLKSYTLQDMINTNEFIKKQNKENKVMRMVFDDRLISALYTILHYDEDLTDEKYNSILAYPLTPYVKKCLVMINTSQYEEVN